MEQIIALLLNNESDFSKGKCIKIIKKNFYLSKILRRTNFENFTPKIFQSSRLCTRRLPREVPWLRSNGVNNGRSIPWSFANVAEHTVEACSLSSIDVQPRARLAQSINTPPDFRSIPCSPVPSRSVPFRSVSLYTRLDDQASKAVLQRAK